MNDGSNGAPESSAPPRSEEIQREGLLQRFPLIVFLAPLFVYLGLAGFEPRPPDPDELFWEDTSPGEWFGIPHGYEHYPIYYTARIGLTVLTVWLVSPGFRYFPRKIGWLGMVVGAVGVVVWVGVCKLDLEQLIFVPIGLGSFLGLGERAAFNPFEMMANNLPWMYTFLAIRFFGLAAVVPLIEEMMVRGFLMRYLVGQQWWKLPIGTVNRAAIVAPAIYGALTHPAEMFAAILWFSMVTWLAIKTRNIWECVVAHAVTNLLLGIYVITWNDWAMW